MMLFQFLFSYLLLFVGLPMLAVRFKEKEEGWIDKLFVALVHSSLFFIIVIHLLVFIKLYETLSLLAVTIAGLVLADRLVNGNKSFVTTTLTLLYDLTDNPTNWRRMLDARIEAAKAASRGRGARLLAALRANWLAALCIAATLAYAAFVRFKHALTHLYFGASDAYVHMTFMKFLAENRIFAETIYPYGFAAVMSAVHKFFILDPYIIVRFIGPTCGMLLVLSIYFALRRVIGANYVFIFVALFVYVFYAGLPSNPWRQISALSMEYAAIFVLPGIAFLITYLRSSRMAQLILAGECLAITVFIHPYVAATLGIAYVLVFLCFWKTSLTKTSIVRFGSVMTAFGVVGAIPLVIAFLTVPAQDMSYLEENIQGTQSITLSRWIDVLASGNPLVLGMLALIVGYALFRWFASFGSKLRERQRSEPAVIAALALFFVFYWIQESAAYGLPTAIPSDRFGVSFALVAAMSLAVLLHLLIRSLPNPRLRRVAQPAVAVLTAAAVFASGNVIAAPEGGRYQYDDNVKVYLQLKEQFKPPFDEWTVVSPMEENHLVIGYGWHYQLWEFLRALEHPDESELKFETHHIFIFVEKVPLGSDTPVTEEEALVPFPEYEGADLTEYYYRNTEIRRILESKAYRWAESYMERHPESVDIYYDSPVLRVYWVRKGDRLEVDFLAP